MSKKRFSKEVRLRAIEDYTSGARSAIQIADDLGVTPQTIYRWRTVLSDEEKGVRLNELISEGSSREQAKKIQLLEFEIETYKGKLAEQVVINDLLKKLQDQGGLPPENELNGLIETTLRLARKRKPAKL